MPQSLREITAVILAGGLGTRLRPVVSSVPKPLAQIAGRPFLAFLLDRLAGAGIRKVVLCTGYLAELVLDELGAEHAGMTLVHSRELEPLGTAGALRWALPQIMSQTALVLNGDSYCHTDLAAFYAWHLSKPGVGSLVLVPRADTRPYGRVETDGAERIKTFVEKGGEALPGWINAGVYLLSRELISAIPPAKPVSLEKELFPVWSEQGLYGYQRQDRFLDIGTPETYRQAEEFFAGLADTCQKEVLDDHQ